MSEWRQNQRLVEIFEDCRAEVRDIAAERPYDPALDALLSYEAGMRAIGEAVRAGAPVPQFLLSRKARG